MKNLLRYWKRRWENEAVVLMYHRITNPVCDPWQLAVTPEYFESHIHIIKKKYRVVSLAELTEQVQQQKIKPNTVAITFDDGFADNVHIAYPILNQFQLPASFYITTDLVDTHDVFWWDQLQTIFLETPHLPAVFKGVIGNELIELQTGNDGILTNEMKSQIKNWRAEQPFINERIKCYYEIWSRLRGFPDDQKKSVLTILAAWASLSLTATDANRVVNVKELQVLASDSLMEVGCHTCSHPALAEHKEATQRQELERSKVQLKKWIGKSVTGLAYPHGSYNQTTLSVAHDLRFKYAVTTAGIAARKSTTALEIPRVQVTNLSGRDFERQLKLWFQV